MVAGESGLLGVPVPAAVMKAQEYVEENAIIPHQKMEESSAKVL